MRDYPSIPNVFRVSSDSTNGVNVIENDGRGNGIAQSLINPSKADVAHENGRSKKIDKELNSVGIELHYRNGKLPECRNNMTCSRPITASNTLPTIASNSSQTRPGNTAINSISGSISASANVSTGFPAKTAEGSDLNISVNTFTDINSSTRSRRFQVEGKRFTSDKYSGYFLWIMTPVAASFSVAIVIAALAGPQWLFTEEKLPNANYNGTANLNVQDDGAFITKYTKSSLWILCTALQGVETYNCIKIDYFPKEGYQPDPHDSTPAIPYTITKSCPFFLASGIFLLISFVVFLVPTCSHQNNLYYFSSGIMFIVSGLFMLIGLIAYISILKAEIGSKLRPRSSLQPALLKVTYGQSFFLYVFGFISTEFVGVLNVFLYISLQEIGYYHRMPCLTFATIQEKLRDGDSRSSKLHTSNKKDKLEISGYRCKKHPTNTVQDLEKRYYFEKPRKCDLHSKNLAKSLNELYTEPAPTHYFLPPLDIHYHQQQEQQSDCAPLTRSVSTATEIFSNGANGTSVPGHHVNSNHNNNNGSIRSGNARKTTTSTNTTQVKKSHDTVTSGTLGNEHDNDSMGSGNGDESSNDKRMRSNSISTGIQDICGLSRGIRKTKDEFFNEFCKRAGVRPKPKDIYFIEDTNDDLDDDNIYVVDNSKPQNPRQHTPHHHQHQQPVYHTNFRRNSMFVEQPTTSSLRKQNSNLSLHADAKLYQKSLFDLERCESEIWNTYPDHLYAKGTGKQLQDCNVHQSRTLPRSFLKRNFDSHDSLLMAVSAAGGGSQNRLPVTGGHNHYQPTTHPASARLSHAFKDPSIYHSGLMFHKSCEDVRNSATLHVEGNNGAFGVNTRRPSTTLLPTVVQWPATIPTSPSNFSSNSFLYGNQHQHQHQHPHQNPNPQPTTGGAMGGRLPPNGGHHNFSHPYTFDNRCSDASAGTGYDAFDLDEIERERRRSHASLFEGRYDAINGTAV